MKKQIITLIIEGTPEQVRETKEFILTATADVLRACHVDNMPAFEKNSKPPKDITDLIDKIFG